MLSANYTIYLVLALTQRSIGHASVTKDEAAGPAGCCTEPRGQSTRPKVCFDLFAPCLVPKIKIPKKKFRHLHGDLNLDEIKNALRLLPVNRETNLMNLSMRN